MIKEIIKKIVSARLIHKVKQLRKMKALLQCFYYDFIRFYSHSAAISGDHKGEATLISSITMDYHRIEKGLANREPRLKFGLWFIPTLIDNIVLYKAKYGDHEMINSAYSAIGNYINFHKDLNVPLPELTGKVAVLESAFESSFVAENSTFVLDWLSVQKVSKNIDFKKFALSRSSVRQYKPQVVEKSVILEAVDIAKKTPSVCNRQPWHIYSLTGSILKNILSLQNGNLGFRGDISNLLIIVGKISYMRHSTERHQIFIDGGLFSMTLMYSLHSLGLGACPLNWCVTPKSDKLLRDAISLKDDDEVIMYMAFGYVEDNVTVTASPRVSSQSLLTLIS